MKSLSIVQTETNHRAQLIHQAVSYYQTKLANHPIRPFCEKGLLSRALVEDFAKIQYVDSTLWVAMLSLARGRVANPKLSEAIRKNILCEVGNSGVPHVTLAQDFVQSLGIPAEFGDYQDYAPLTAHSVKVMNVFDQAGDGVIGGWLLVAETLVPTLFSMFRPSFQHHAGADLRYLDEHITIDAEEHSQWMLEAAVEISETEAGFKEIIHGIDLGARVTLSVPDALYAAAFSASTVGKRGLAC